ncbi:hypothetical protein [Lysinibacillus agricola]|uniref:hypothetical protein n=1 Tax=Lysinibacillus agricola TaxID=2590012 RepID=UPI003C141B77
MTSKFELRERIDEFLEALSLNRVDRFYPSALSKYLNVTPGEAFNLLLERAGNEDQLILLWEIRCSECYRTIEVSKEPMHEEYDCMCGEEVEISQNNLFPVFKINPIFKDYLKKKTKDGHATKPNYVQPANLGGSQIALEKLIEDFTPSEKALSVLEQQLPQNIYNIFISDGGTFMTNNQPTNNSTTISGGTFTGNQFAAGSSNFRGTINNITGSQKDELLQITESLITALMSEKEKFQDINVEEVAETINQVTEEATKEKVNKFSLNGLLTGINAAIGNVTSISASTMQLYQQWHEHISSLFS